MQTTAEVIEEGLVVQLVRIPACHAGGREFESRPVRKSKNSYIYIQHMGD